MRGNLEGGYRRQVLQESIPAHAGKPELVVRLRRPEKVYPRPCGETVSDGMSANRSRGLSPPMRGNRRIAPCPIPLIGSIPAHAGKPQAHAGNYIQARVYPRPCGET